MQTFWSRCTRASFVVLWALLCALAPTPSRAADWQAGAGPDWTALLAAARAEGKVVVAGSPALSTPLIEAFKRDTGIDLEFLGGNPREISSRLLREAQSNNVTIDLSFGGATDILVLYPKGYLVPLKPQLILPGTKDGPQWINGKSLWVDNEGQYMLRGTLAVFGWPLVNTSIIPPGKIKTWKDLLAPEYKGKIAAYDPTAGGQGQGVAAYLADHLGVDFMTALYVGQNVRYTRNDNQLVDWVARGTYPIALGTAQANVEKFREQGLPIAALAPEDGRGYTSSGFGTLKETKGAPHPKAAAVFANWYASAPGQEAYSRVMLEPPTRLDAVVPEVPEYVRPKPGLDYTDTHSETWYVQVRPAVTDLVVKALGGR